MSCDIISRYWQQQSRSHRESNTVIATKFCTWHDSRGMSKNLLRSEGQQRIYSKVSIEFELRTKSLVKRAPEP